MVVMEPIKRKRVYTFNFGRLSSRQREIIGLGTWDIYPNEVLKSRAYSCIQAITQVTQMRGGMHKIDEMWKYADDFISESKDVLPKDSVIVNWLARYFTARDLNGYGRLPKDQKVTRANEFYNTHGIGMTAEEPPRKKDLMAGLKAELAKNKRQELTGMYRRIERKMIEEQEKQAIFERTGFGEQLSLF